MNILHPKSAALAAMLCSAAAVQAVVDPNPASLLAGKNVLVINGTEATSNAHGAARQALTVKLTQLQATVGFTWTQASGSSPPTNLEPYDIIVFNYWFHSDRANQASFAPFQTAFRAWVNSTNRKRGWVGMHTSGANEVNEWNWFRDSVTSMLYTVHPAGTPAGTIRRTLDTSILSQPIMQGLPDTFRVPADEWYTFTYGPTWPGVRVMYNLDEATLTTPPPAEYAMNPHPMAWYRESPVTGNRFFYTALVHNASGVNSTAGNDFFTSLILRALEYAADYQPVSIRLNGRGLVQASEKLTGVRHLRRGEDLRIEAPGAYRVEVLSMQGRVLFRASGRDRGIHRPAALTKPGLYIVKVAAGETGHSQRVMVQ